MTYHIKIHVAEDAPDFWECVCGNFPMDEGFYPCNKRGELIEPAPHGWAKSLYACGRCGRIIDPQTLEIVGYRRGGEQNAKG